MTPQIPVNCVFASASEPAGSSAEPKPRSSALYMLEGLRLWISLRAANKN